MGKLVEKLQQVSQGSSGVGFLGPRKPTQAPRPTALLVSLGAGEGTAAEAAAKNGADAVVVTDWQPSGDLSKVRSALEANGAIWGVEYAPGRSGEGALKQAQDAGASFAIIGQSSSAHALFEELEAFDLVVEVPVPKDDLGLLLLRAENLLPVQTALLRAQLTSAELASMTVADFARLRLACESLRFPTLLVLAGVPEMSHVRTLVRLGVSGLVLPGAGLSADRLGTQVKSLREQLEKTPARDEDRSHVAIGSLMEAGGQSLTTRPQRREPSPDPDEE
jgi:hypothetical protein